MAVGWEHRTDKFLCTIKINVVGGRSYLRGYNPFYKLLINRVSNYSVRRHKLDTNNVILMEIILPPLHPPPPYLGVYVQGYV